MPEQQSQQLGMSCVCGEKAFYGIHGGIHEKKQEERKKETLCILKYTRSAYDNNTTETHTHTQNNVEKAKQNNLET